MKLNKILPSTTLIAAAALTIGLPRAAHAATTVVVTNHADDGSATSLRGAIDAANADGGEFTIQLEGGATYVVDRFCLDGDPHDNHGGDLDLSTNANVRIVARVGEMATIAVQCAGERVLQHFGAGELTFERIRLTGGNIAKGLNGDQNGDRNGISGQSGGAVMSYGWVRLVESIVEGNHAGDGGNGAPPLFGGTGGNGGHGGHGGAVFANQLSVWDTTIRDNWSGNGGKGGNGLGAGNTGGTGGTGGGAGALIAPEVFLSGSEVYDNHAGNGGAGGHGLGAGAPGGAGGGGGAGGAVAATALNVYGSTLTANIAGSGGAGGNGNGGPGGAGGSAARGGGLFAIGAELEQSTIHANTTGLPGNFGTGAPNGTPGQVSRGGGLTILNGVGSTIIFTTVTGNQATAAANIDAPPQTQLTASIVGEPMGGANCSGFLTSGGYNVEDSGSCGIAANDVLVPAVDVGPLVDVGGRTRVRVPQPESAAIELIPAAACEPLLPPHGPTDQRGLIRPYGDCEAGSVEVPPASASMFVPLPPARVFDTREPGPATGYVGAGTTRTVQFSGVAGIPPVGATAVAFNLTIDAAGGAGYVAVHPTGGDDQLTSNLNSVEAGQTVPNLVVVPLGEGGRLDFFSQSGAHLIGDVVGYFVETPHATGGRIIPLTPARIFDTREPGPHSGKLPAGGTITVDVTGVAGVPEAGVSAVVLNVTGTQATAAGYITLYPGGIERPWASTLNMEGAGHTAPNMTIIPVGADGTVSFYSQSGVHLVADVTGYVTDETAPLSSEGLFIPLEPGRVFDTREATPSRKLAAGGQIDVTVATKQGIPAFATAAMLNLTGTEADDAGYVTGWPEGGDRPLASTLNLTRPGETRANAALLPIGHDGMISFYSQSGTHLLADVFGYLLPDPYVFTT